MFDVHNIDTFAKKFKKHGNFFSGSRYFFGSNFFWIVTQDFHQLSEVLALEFLHLLIQCIEFFLLALDHIIGCANVWHNYYVL